MFRIEGHEYVKAANANRVALYLGADVYAPHGGFSRTDIAETVNALDVGEAVTLRAIGWRGLPASPITVTRVAA